MANLYRLKSENSKFQDGALTKLHLALYQLDQLASKGINCTVVDEHGSEYQPPEPVATPKAIASKYPSPRPMMIDAIAAHLNKPENVARREEARLGNANQWAKLRNS